MASGSEDDAFAPYDPLPLPWFPPMFCPAALLWLSSLLSGLPEVWPGPGFEPMPVLFPAAFAPGEGVFFARVANA